jgi:hypothetical protein
LAVAWVIDCGDHDGASARAYSVQPHLMASAAVVLAVAVVILGNHGLRIAEARRAARSEPLPVCAAWPAESWRGDIGLSYVFDQTLQMRRHAIGGPNTGAADIDPVLALFCAVDERADAGTSPYLMMVGLLFRNEAAFAQGVPIAYRTQLAVAWEARLRQFLAVAPRRSDLAAPLLATWIQARQFARVHDFARELLRRTPGDPVGLYFLGIVRLATAESATHRQEGIQLTIARGAPARDRKNCSTR